MRVTSKLFYGMEGAAFFLYWKSFYYPRLERIMWRLYWWTFRGLCALLKPFDNSRKLSMP
jgi:hypothetical protein